LIHLQIVVFRIIPKDRKAIRCVLKVVGLVVLLVLWVAFAFQIVIAMLIADACADSNRVVLETVSIFDIGDDGVDIVTVRFHR
jgi:hypothetical protein